MSLFKEIHKTQKTRLSKAKTYYKMSDFDIGMLIRIGTGFNCFCRPGSGSRKARMANKNRRKILYFKFML
jgi:hypothetical protein